MNDRRHNILFVTTFLPGRLQSGSEICTQAIVDALRSLGHRVHVVGYVRKGHEFAPEHEDDTSAGSRIIETAEASCGVRSLWMGRALLKQEPYSCAKYVSRMMRQTVRKVMDSHRPDLVIIDHVQLAWLMDMVPAVPVVMIAHNIEADVYRQMLLGGTTGLGRWALGREATQMARWEIGCAKLVDQIWTISDHDREHFARLAPTRMMEVHSFMTVTAGAAPLPDKDVVLLGTWTWQPNALGLRWFIERILPLLPDAIDIHVAGKGADWLRSLAPRVTYHGFVMDSAGFARTGRVCAIPGVAGGGLQIKTLDAIALGLPIVASPVSLRGIHDPPGTVVAAESERSFALAIERMINHPPGSRVCEEAIRWSASRRQRLAEGIREAVNDLLAGGGSPRRAAQGRGDGPRSRSRPEDRSSVCRGGGIGVAQAFAAQRRIRVLGLEMDAVTEDELIADVESAVQRKARFVVGNHNMNSVRLVQSDDDMRAFYDVCDRIYIDGMPLILIGRLLGHFLQRRQRITLLDFYPKLLGLATKHRWRICWLGGRADIAERGAAKLREQHVGLDLVTVDGYFDAQGADNERVLRTINSLSPDLLMVGMGMPRQERWVLSNHLRLNARVIWCCGATMDYIAGAIPTPPRWMGRIGLEWLFRLGSEPRRLWRRYLIEPWGLLPCVLRELNHRWMLPPDQLRSRPAPPPPSDPRPGPPRSDSPEA
ncbi:MAG: WecB/TagA/CpsF family glycosyltransferase [Phycisphaeraceae bacterium]|nr:WecB/TagA/CpsF family glycosyltransferase [Phycisphaeraceae bacterium]